MSIIYVYVYYIYLLYVNILQTESYIFTP